MLPKINILGTRAIFVSIPTFLYMGTIFKTTLSKLDLAPKPFIIGTQCYTYLEIRDKYLQLLKNIQHSNMKYMLGVRVLLIKS